MEIHTEELQSKDDKRFLKSCTKYKARYLRPSLVITEGNDPLLIGTH